MTPFFKGNAPITEGLENTRTLNMHQGGNEAEFYQSRRETTSFFPLERQQVFGNTFGEGMGDPSRYDAGILRTNQLPFTQERVSHIDVSIVFVVAIILTGPGSVPLFSDTVAIPLTVSTFTVL